MKRLIPALLAAAALVFPATASAGLTVNRPIGGPAIVKSLQIAAAFHGAMPNCSGGGGVYAATQAEMASIGHPNGIGYGYRFKAPYNRCGIWIRDGFGGNNPAYAQMVYGCTLIVHEYGHLIDKVHTSDPTASMYSPTRWRYPVRACYDTFAPGAYGPAYQQLVGGIAAFVHP